MGVGVHFLILASSFLFLESNLKAAIVAGIESGWVNPVINKEYAMEEVVDCMYVCRYYHHEYFSGPAGALRHHPLQRCEGQACPPSGNR